MLREVLVTGATGALGTALVDELHRSGRHVRVLVRKPELATDLPEYLQAFRGDITDERTLALAVRGVDTVFHLAALLHLTGEGMVSTDDYRRVNVDGTGAVVHAARQAGVRRLVYFSSISVYGDTRGQIADELTLPRPGTAYADSKLCGEALVLAERGRPSRGQSATVLRLAAAYGPHMQGNYRRLLQAIARGLFVPVGAASNRRTLIHEEDVAAASLLAADHPGAAGEVFNLTDGHIHTVREILEAIGAAVGRPLPRWRAPLALAQLAAVGGDTALHVLGRASGLYSSLKRYTEDVAVSGTKIQRLLGFAPRYDLGRGWEHTVATLRQLGEF